MTAEAPQITGNASASSKATWFAKELLQCLILVLGPTVVAGLGIVASWALRGAASTGYQHGSHPFYVLFLITVFSLLWYGIGVVLVRWIFSDLPWDLPHPVNGLRLTQSTASEQSLTLSPGQQLRVEKAASASDDDQVRGGTFRLTDWSIAHLRTRNLYLPLSGILLFPLTVTLLRSAMTRPRDMLTLAEQQTLLFLWPAFLTWVVLVCMTLGYRVQAVARYRVWAMRVGQVAMLAFVLLLAVGNSCLNHTIKLLSIDPVAFVRWNTVLLAVVFAAGAFSAVLPARTFRAPSRIGAVAEAVLFLALPITLGLLVGMLPLISDLGKVTTSAIDHLAWPVTLVLAYFLLKPVIDELLKNMQTFEAFGTMVTFNKREKKDLKVPVTSFEELMKVVKDLIEKTEKHDTVRFMAYTPALGYLARTPSEWDALCGIMHEKRERLQIICLKDEHLWMWHAMFDGKRTARGKVNKELIAKANTVAMDLLKPKDVRKDLGCAGKTGKV